MEPSHWRSILDKFVEGDPGDCEGEVESKGREPFGRVKGKSSRSMVVEPLEARSRAGLVARLAIGMTK